MTWRRLGALIRALPPTALLWADLQEQREGAQKPTPEQIRARQEYHRRREVQHG